LPEIWYKKYTLNRDGSIDVGGDLDLGFQRLSKLITTIEGSPRSG
jgi:hypothetical protein